ncbi:MAG: hypothetical protein NC084_11305 [Bacteroides sp.]|nr:hypothetical protein [Eubacterium sp.]MCM1419455.1 hypothetical protein [Roseburia sp.]MCM1463277.1 hypothetical protein [Bacteroides sp.]
MGHKVKVTYDTSEEAKAREVAWIREKALHDEASLLNGAREEGRAEGREKIIARMRAYGMTEEEIQKILRE